MKVQIIFVLLLCMAACSVAGELDPAKRYTILGKYIAIGEQPSSASDEDDASVQEFEGDLSSATIVVSMNIADDDEEPLFLEISRAVISNGRVVIEGELDKPTLAKISVESDIGMPLTVLTMLVPGQVVSFAVLDHEERSAQDWLVIVETLKLAKTPTKKFRIVGDLTGVDGERYPMPMVLVHSSKFDEKGDKKSTVFGPVLAKDKSFLIEGEVDEPRTVEIMVVSNKGRSWGSVQAIVEPNAVISVVVSSRWAHQLVATTGAGKHAKVIGTWRMGEQYLSAEDAIDEEFMRARTGTRNSNVEDTTREQAKSEQINDDTDADKTGLVTVDSSKMAEALAVVERTQYLAPASGCEHAIVPQDSTSQKRQQNTASPGGRPRYTLEPLYEIRNAALQDIAMNAEDPFDALLALELDPFVVLGAHSPSGAALPVYDRLMTLLDDNIVARRVKPARDALAQSVARDANSRKLIPGQKAPSFKLPTLAGELISLSEVLDRAEYVFVDFWASWCGPCIEDFPVLKNVYSSYKDNGLEVISISVDGTYDDWKDAAERNELPWIDLGSIGGILTETPVSYGILHMPAGLLIDHQGCIIKKDIRPEQLKELLADSFD
ncbi:MAG: TlpA disulfide reductase family protein [Gammaproteobacteria bacterium]|nr:TlpA disulfide reductase family protein [Gammaproteobacteria bacterium]